MVFKLLKCVSAILKMDTEFRRGEIRWMHFKVRLDKVEGKLRCTLLGRCYVRGYYLGLTEMEL